MLVSTFGFNVRERVGDARVDVLDRRLVVLAVLLAQDIEADRLRLQGRGGGDKVSEVHENSSGTGYPRGKALPGLLAVLRGNRQRSDALCGREGGRWPLQADRCAADGDGPDKTGSGPVCGHCRAGAAIEGLTSRRRAPGLSAACWGNDAFRRGALPRERTASTSRRLRGRRSCRSRALARAGHRGQPRRRGAMRLATVVPRIFSVRAVVARTAGP